MLSVNALYEDGKVTLLEAIPEVRRARLIVTVLEPLTDAVTTTDAVFPADIFADLTGALALREDGSVAHDRYLGEQRS